MNTPNDRRIMREIYWDYGYRLVLEDGRLKARGSGKAALPDKHRRWIATHKEQLIEALELKDRTSVCSICGASSVARLKADDKVIIDGMQRVRPGVEVAPKPARMDSRPGDEEG